MKTAEIEKRLAIIEEKLARLTAASKSAPSAKAHPVQTLESIHGTFEDDEAFREAMRLGRKWRKSQDVKPRGKARAKHK